MSEAERVALLGRAPLHLRCWLLLCSDLAIRSGTAAALTPGNYDRNARTLTFTTKYGEAQTLPVTHELQQLFERPGLVSTLPIVGQLPRGPHRRWGSDLKPRDKQKPVVCVNHLRSLFKQLCADCGITRRIVPHDLRRTTARRVYQQTHDLRIVQAVLGHVDLNSTVWYLQDELTEVAVSTLELAKLNPLTEREQ